MTERSTGVDRDDVAAFYTKIARPYDRFATSVLFADMRDRAVAALDLEAGDTVLELGCGTAGNVPSVLDRIGAHGTYLGVDASQGMLERGRRRRGAHPVRFVRGDATRPPFEGPFDGILATFVTGLLPDPAGAVSGWIDRLSEDGRLVLLDAAGRDGTRTPLDWAFSAFVILAAPPSSWRRDAGGPRRLRARVDAAHRSLETNGRVVERAQYWRGFVRLAAAEPDPDKGLPPSNPILDRGRRRTRSWLAVL